MYLVLYRRKRTGFGVGESGEYWLHDTKESAKRHIENLARNDDVVFWLVESPNITTVRVVEKEVEVTEKVKRMVADL